MRPNMVGAIIVLLVVAGCFTDTSPSTAASAAVAPVPAVTTTAASTTTAAFIDDSWPTSTPEEQGMSSAMLAGLFDEIVDKGYRVDGVVIVRHGHKVVEATGPNYDIDDLHIVHSVTKSIVSTLIGMIVEDGFLHGIDERVVDIFDDRTIENLGARKEVMTIEHLLTMTAGFDCRDSYLYEWEGLHELWGSDDWTQHVLDLPMIAEPGERFEYCNSASFLLSAIITEVTGRSAEEYARERLFGPLDVTEFAWPANPDGISIGWGELMIAPRDLARFGQLVLDGGRWGGEQIVPEGWITEATQPRIEATLQDDYGYQWWIRRDGIVEALGYQGQYVIIDRERDIVAVFASTLPDDEFFVPDALYDTFIAPAVVSNVPVPPDSQGAGALRIAIARW